MIFAQLDDMHVPDQIFSDKTTLLEILGEFESAAISSAYEGQWLPILEKADNDEEATNMFVAELMQKYDSFEVQNTDSKYSLYGHVAGVKILLAYITH